MSSTARDGGRAVVPVGGEAASLVESAMLLRWRAPELALLLADRAVTAAQDDQMAVLRADHLAVFALNRLGRHEEAAHRLFPAIRNEETPPGLRHELHVELAHCAVALGEPVIALEAVRTVLAAGDDIPSVLRGTALVVAAEASAALGRADLVTSALDEADELYREDPSLDRDTALLLRATARVVDAARHRRDGAAAEAEAQATAGRELLTGLADPEHDSGEVSARLLLEMVIALLDRDDGDVAIVTARPLLRRPVRAAAAGAVGRLRLALATRVHLAEGRHESALTLLADAVEGAQRHGLDAVLAECLEGLSHVHEARGEFADALHCMRAARAAESRHCRSVEAGRSTLRQHWKPARCQLDSLVDDVSALLTGTAASCVGADPDNSALLADIAVGIMPDRAPAAEGSQAQIEQVQTAETEAPETATQRADAAELETVEVDIAELEAVEVDVVELEAVDGDIVELEAVKVDVVELEAAEPLPEPATVSAMAPMIKTPEPASGEPADRLPAEATPVLDNWQPGARHRRGTGAVVCVSDLLPPSALSAGRAGRRHAEESGEEPAESTPIAELRVIAEPPTEESNAARPQETDHTDATPVPTAGYPLAVEPPSGTSATPEPEDTGTVESEDVEESAPARREPPGPPPAPTPRVLEWEPADAGSAGDGESRQMGLGDLLAEALAAYRDVRAAGVGRMTSRADDEVVVADAGPSRDAPRYGRPGARWTAGLQLAPSIDRPQGDPSEALTNPLLRLPDFTAEPRWIPPEAGRRPAAGD